MTYYRYTYTHGDTTYRSSVSTTTTIENPYLSPYGNTTFCGDLTLQSYGGPYTYTYNLDLPTDHDLYTPGELVFFQNRSGPKSLCRVIKKCLAWYNYDTYTLKLICKKNLKKNYNKTFNHYYHLLSGSPISYDEKTSTFEAQSYQITPLKKKEK